jgi:hypothetical protein
MQEPCTQCTVDHLEWNHGPLAVSVQNKLHLYLEYHSVCPLVLIRSPNADEWIKSLALCLLCGVHCTVDHFCAEYLLGWKLTSLYSCPGSPGWQSIAFRWPGSLECKLTSLYSSPGSHGRQPTAPDRIHDLWSSIGGHSFILFLHSAMHICKPLGRPSAALGSNLCAQLI